MPRTGVHSKSKVAGKYQRNKPLVVTCERVSMDLDPDVWMFWNASGELFADPELTQPLGLTIVRVIEVGS